MGRARGTEFQGGSVGPGTAASFWMCSFRVALGASIRQLESGAGRRLRAGGKGSGVTTASMLDMTLGTDEVQKRLEGKSGPRRPSWDGQETAKTGNSRACCRRPQEAVLVTGTAGRAEASHPNPRKQSERLPQMEGNSTRRHSMDIEAGLWRTCLCGEAQLPERLGDKRRHHGARGGESSAQVSPTALRVRTRARHGTRKRPAPCSRRPAEPFARLWPSSP